MTRRMQYNIFFGMAGALCLLIAPGRANAQVTLPTVTQLGGGLFRYNYSLFNFTANDLFEVDIHVPVGANVTNLLTPTVNGDPFAFAAAYDSGLGLVSFLENDSVFTRTPLSGFSFDTNLRPQNGTFDAYFAPATGGITVSSGSTLTPVPEPGSIALCGAVGLVSAFALRRRRRQVSR